MTKVRGPLFSIKAAGTLGKAITYKKGVFGNVVRNYRRPKIKYTAGQQNVRWWFQRGVWTWQGKSGEHGYYFSRGCYGLEEPARASWRLFRTVRSLFGYYAFMKRWMEKSLVGEPQYQVPPYFGFCVANEWLANFLYASGKFHDWTSSLPPVPPIVESQYVEGIVALWHMDEAYWDGTPGEVIDSSGNNNNGVRKDNATTAPGKFNNGGILDGTLDRVEIPHDSSYGIVTGQVTYLMWVKKAEDGTLQILFDKNSATPEPIYARFNGDDTMYLQIYYNSGNYWFASSSETVTGTEYHLIGFVCNYDDWSESKIYIDGAVATLAKTQVGSEQNMANTGVLTMGATNVATNELNGIIDEAVVVNREIPPAEMLQIFNNNLPLRVTP